MKPLRIRPFKIINKISDFTYEIVNQDGYTSHIHRNHLVPYYPKEPIIFPFIQQYNLHPNDYKIDYKNSNVNDSINSSNPISEEQLVEDENHTFMDSNKETTDIPSTIDYQRETFNPSSPFPYQQKNQKTNNTNPEYQSDIHDYDNYINPRRHTSDRYNFRPQPRKDYRIFLGEKKILSFSQNSAERKLASK